MKTPQKKLCPIERNYYELLLKKQNDRQNTPLKDKKIEILSGILKDHDCEYGRHKDHK